MARWIIHICAALLFCLGMSSSAYAIEPAWVGARVGTLGQGAEVGVRIVPMVVVRGIGQMGNANENRTLDGVRYDGDLDLQSFGAQLDFHPILLPVYVTAGAYINDNKLVMHATPSAPITIGTQTFIPSEIGTLDANISFGSTALYGGAGIEFGLGPVSASLEAGVFMQGTPEISLSASGTAGSSDRFLAQRAAEAQAMAGDLKNLRTYPAITFQGRWRF